MSAKVFSHGKEALAFIDEIKNKKTSEELLECFNAYLIRRGFTAWLITGVPPKGYDIAPLVLLNGWSPEWYSVYRKERFIDDDPCAERVLETFKPFPWSEVVFDHRREKRQRLIMDLAASFGMRKGICVPIHGLDGFEAAVTVAGRDPDISLQSLSSLSLVSMFVHSRASHFADKKKKVGRLSVREREVLTWTTIGRNSEDIGETLGVSKNCVEMYLKRAAVKLGTRGRMRTVIEAYRRGEIEFP